MGNIANYIDDHILKDFNRLSGMNFQRSRHQADLNFTMIFNKHYAVFSKLKIPSIRPV